MSKFCPKCSGLVPNPNMTVCPNCGADLSNVTEDILDMNVPINNGVVNSNVNNGSMNNNINSGYVNSSPMNNSINNGYMNNIPMNNSIGAQQTAVDNQPKLDPNLNFANSSIFRESANSASNNPNNNVTQNNQSSINGTFFNQNVNNNFNSGNQFASNANSMPNGNYNEVNYQGTNVSQNVTYNQVNGRLPVGKKRSNLKTIIMSCSLLLVLVVAVVVLMIVNSGPKAVIKKYYNGYKSFNVNKVVSTYPKSMRDDKKEELEDILPEMKDYYDEEDIKTKKIEISSDYETVKKSELSYLFNYLDEEYDIKKSSIDEIRKYDVTTVTIVDGEEKEDEGTIMVFKIGLKWYILN